MLISYESAIETIESIKFRKVNISETIRNTQKASFLNENSYYCQPINSQDMMEDRFSDDDYFGTVYKSLEKNNGIYIALAYLCESSPPDSDCFILDDEYFDRDYVKYDDYDNIVGYYYIDSAYEKVYIQYPVKYGLSFDMASDYGISIKKENEEYKIRLGHRQDNSEGATVFCEFGELTDMTDQNSLANPLNQLMIYLMENVIVFEE